MTEPLVDVLIPVFNAATTVRSAIDSIQRQTVRDIRILVVDDGSTDDTGAIVASMAEADRRIELVRQPNGGIVDALNNGLALARARFLARHDGDDLAFPERLERQLAYLDANPSCVAVGASVRHIDEEGRFRGSVVHLASPEDSRTDWAPCLEPYIIHPFLTTYTDKVRRVGGYRHVFNAEDSDLYWRLQDLGPLHNLHEVLGEYRMHTQSVSAASILGARINALNSQLAGMSARRRRAGQPDLVFAADAKRDYQRARTLDAIVALGARQLNAEESGWLRVATAAKLLELASYRPFEPDIDDCRFIRNAIRTEGHRLSVPNQVFLGRVSANAAARLLTRRRGREAMALTPPSLYRKVAARVAFRTVTKSPALRRVIRRVGNRADFLK